MAIGQVDDLTHTATGTKVRAFEYGAGDNSYGAIYLWGTTGLGMVPARIKALFPKARFARLTGAGHWLHADRPREFEEAVRVFLNA